MKPIAYYILLILVLLSLALNVVVLGGLWTARTMVVEALDASLETMAGLEGETFATTVRVQQSVPVRAEVPFQRELNVPINLSVPISEEITFRETLQIPVNTLVGTYNVRVPISTSLPISLTIPINTEVPIAVSDTFPISTQIDSDIALPVAIRIADTPLVEYLKQIRETLQMIRDRLAPGGA